LKRPFKNAIRLNTQLILCLLWPFENRTWAYLGLQSGKPLLFVAVLVNKLVPWWAWLISGAL